MMYHLKFSLTGGASCSVGSPVALAVSGFCSSGFSVAVIVVSFSRFIRFSLLALPGNSQTALVVLGQTVQQGFNGPADDVVHQPEVRREDEDGDEDHDRRPL